MPEKYRQLLITYGPAVNRYNTAPVTKVFYPKTVI